MAFRLPTHLDSFIPPPSERVLQSRPWRGTLIVSGLRASDKGVTQNLVVTAVETDGDNRSDLWPSHLYVHPTHDRPVLGQVQDWVRRHSPPLCTFIPDRLRDSTANAVNQATFRSFSRILFDNQMVALAPWHHGQIPGAGIIIYPAQNSSALLVGAVLLSSPFPEFIVNSGQLYHSPVPLSPRHYQDSLGSPSTSYGPVPYNEQRHAISSHRHPHLSNPAAQAGPDKQDQYRFIMPRPTAYPSYPTPSATDSSWPVIKNEEGNVSTTYVPSHRSSLGQNPQYPQ